MTPRRAKDGAIAMTDIAPVDQEESLTEPLLSEQQREAVDEEEQEEQEPFLEDNRQEEPAIIPPESCRDSLARSASIPIKIIIPLLTIATHLIFFYGQTRPMWRLTTMHQVDVYATATSLPARLAFDTLGFNHTYHLYQEEQEREIRSFTYAFAIHELWMARHMPGSKFLPRLAAILLTLVSGVWPHLKLVLLNLAFIVPLKARRRRKTLQWLSALGKWSLADVLVVCVMVGVLSLSWDIQPDQVQQGFEDNLPLLLHLLQTTYTSTQLCETGLKMTCDPLPNNIIQKLKCQSCIKAVNTAYNHPEWSSSQGQDILEGIATSGSGRAQMVVVGMNGIYAFCAAVILSILLSLIVDVIHHNQGKRKQQQELRELQNEAQPLVVDGTTNSQGCDDEEMATNDSTSHVIHHNQGKRKQQEFREERNEADRTQPLVDSTTNMQSPLHLEQGCDDDEEMATTGSTSHVIHHNQGIPKQQEFREQRNEADHTQSLDVGTTNLQSPLQLEQGCDNDEEMATNGSTSRALLRFRFANFMFPLAVVVIVALAVSLPTMQRRVNGAIPTLLHDILGITWTKSYSLTTLALTTGDAGGLDLLLMGTFGLFVVVGPLLRSILTCVVPLLRKDGAAMRVFTTAIDFIGAFCAWEVFVVAMVMVDLLMPAITSTVIMDDRCAEVSSDGTCLEVEFDILKSFCLIVIGGFLVLVVSNLGSSLLKSRYDTGNVEARECR